MDRISLCPEPAEVRLAYLIADRTSIIIVGEAYRAVACCPLCGTPSAQVHSRYTRVLADLPWHGLPVTMRLSTRRFFCRVPGCQRRIFTERFGRTVMQHARRTARLADALELLGLALGGEPGARVASALGMATSGDTVLRHLRSDMAAVNADGPRVTTRVLGVDDWAWRKGQTYGTILVDLEHHRVIDLLPDREADTLASWLRAHPGTEIISRDRAGAYADGATRGAPDAIQIADRFHPLVHLLKNLTDAVQHVMEHHQRVLRGVDAALLAEVGPTVGPTVGPVTPTPVVLVKRGGPVSQRERQPLLPERRKVATRERRHARYEQVVALYARGLTQAAISREVGVSRKTITRWLAVDGFPERRAAQARSTTLTPHADYLRQRWDEGCHTVTQLWRELRESYGFRGGLSTVRGWVYSHLRGLTTTTPRTPTTTAESSGTAQSHPFHRPSLRRAAWLLTASAERLKPPEQAYVDAVCAACPEIATAHTLAADFRHMLREKDCNALSPWLAAAEQSELRSLAVGLRRDRDAVLAAILFRWSNGQVEGQVNRLKLLKRTMYGRASFALLRRRVLAA